MKINPAQWPLDIALTENDRDLLVERDAVTHSRRAALISFDRLVHQSGQCRLEFVRRLVNADDVFVVRFDRRCHLQLESLNRHAVILTEGDQF